MPTTRALHTLHRDAPAEIVSIDEADIQLALLNLGVRIGDQCRVENLAPFGDPLAIAVNGTKIALRKADAAHVWVKPLA